jgi:ATP-dependent Lhr-like helicase
MHLSTLVHQLLSLVAEKGGVRADEAYRTLCRRGPFELEAPAFANLLRGLASREVIMQSEDGTLLHGPVGEKIVNHYTFYPTFWSTEEFRVTHGGKTLGTICASQPVAKNSLILFGGRRWRVLSVDEQARVIEVVPAQGGRAPKFAGGTAGSVHARIHQEMFRILGAADTPVYLDQTGRSLLIEGRDQFARAGLNTRRLLPVDGSTLVFLWAGDRVANTLLAHLQAYGFTVETFGVGLMVADVEPPELLGRFREWIVEGPPSAEVLAEAIPNKIIEKYDALLPADLLAENYGRAMLSPMEAWAELERLVKLALFSGA